MKKIKKFERVEINTGDKEAALILEQIDTIAVTCKPMLLKNTSLVSIENAELISEVVDKLEKIGFILQYKPSRSLRMVNPFGFSVFFGKLMSFDKYDKFKIQLEGTSGMYRREQRFPFFNKTIELVEEVVRKYSNGAPETRISRLDINRGFLAKDINNILGEGYFPAIRRKMEMTKYFRDKGNLSRCTGVRFSNSTTPRC